MSLRGGAGVWRPYSYQAQSGISCSVIHVGGQGRGDRNSVGQAQSGQGFFVFKRLALVGSFYGPTKTVNGTDSCLP